MSFIGDFLHHKLYKTHYEYLDHWVNRVCFNVISMDYLEHVETSVSGSTKMHDRITGEDYVMPNRHIGGLHPKNLVPYDDDFRSMFLEG